MANEMISSGYNFYESARLGDLVLAVPGEDVQQLLSFARFISLSLSQQTN